MTILLDIDGALVTTPSWQKPELLPDGFSAFNEKATANLSALIQKTNASIVLTTSHRISYTPEEWKSIFKIRGIETNAITKINDRSSVSIMPTRLIEIEEWVAKYGNEDAYVIIDDDPSLQDLPAAVKNKWVVIKPMLGLDDEALATALHMI